MGFELTKDDIEILVLKENQGMSYSAIANELGISKTRVRQKYERAKRREIISNKYNNPANTSFENYAMANLETTTYIALMNANIRSYHDFIKLSPLDMVMIKGIGPKKLDELTKFREKIISYVIKENGK